MRIVLASASPARLRILGRAGVRCDVVVPGIDEEAITAPSTPELVVALAQAKGRAVLPRLDGPALVIAADSLLELAGRHVGKPHTPERAAAQWRAQRGREAVLHTGHWVGLLDTDGDLRERAAAAATWLRFADVTDAEIDAYVATGEPLGAAGAFTIDGLGGAFVERLDGDPHNVVGLSLPLLRHLCAELGVAWPSLWDAR